MAPHRHSAARRGAQGRRQRARCVGVRCDRRAQRDGATLRLKEGGGVFYAPGPLHSVAAHWPRLVAGAESGELYDLEVQEWQFAGYPRKNKKEEACAARLAASKARGATEVDTRRAQAAEAERQARIAMVQAKAA